MNYAKNAVAEIDWENYFANKLISNGTAIYFSDDNLVTVTNLVDGSLGLATDITNNELGDGTEINRLGAAVASLSTQEQVEINSNPYQLLKSSLDIEQEFGLNLTLVGHSISIPFTGNYDINVTNTIGVATNYTGTGVFTLTGITPVFISKIDGTHNNGFELFDFNQSKGATVISHASALICALGGLVQSGYVRANTGVSLVGYLFSGSTTALLQLTGAYSGTVTYVDDTTLAINGSGNYTVDNSHVKAIKKIDVTDTEKTYLYDGTSGDESKLIETQYANHASISNDSTTGFQPIIEKEVLTIGNDAKWDYINVGTGLSAQQNPSSAKNTHFKVMTDVVENATRYIHNNLEVNWQITVEGNKEYNGSDDSVFKVSKPNDRVNFSFYDNKTSVFFKHLQIERPKITAATVSVTNIAFDRCLLDGLMAETYALMTGNRLERGYIVKDSKVRNFKTSADEGYTTYLNSIVIDCSGNYSSYSNIGGSSSHIETYATDTLSILTTNHFKYGASIPKCFDSGVSGSNNMSSDDSALTHGIGAQDAGLEAYFDNNGQLTQAGQSATKNQGYLGSNMVEWAYAVTATINEVHVGAILINADTQLSTNGYKSSFGSFSIASIIGINVSGKKNSQGKVLLSQGASLKTSGEKSVKQSVKIQLACTPTFHGKKSINQNLSIFPNCKIDTKGKKSAFGNVNLNNVATFTISGTAANIISHSGGFTIAANVGLLVSGHKSTKANFEIANQALLIHQGKKTIVSGLSLSALANISIHGQKSTTASFSFNNTTNINLIGYNHFVEPITRTITINGYLVSMKIPCNLSNTITIQGAL